MFLCLNVVSMVTTKKKVIEYTQRKENNSLPKKNLNTKDNRYLGNEGQKAMGCIENKLPPLSLYMD